MTLARSGFPGGAAGRPARAVAAKLLLKQKQRSVVQAAKAFRDALGDEGRGLVFAQGTLGYAERRLILAVDALRTAETMQ